VVRRANTTVELRSGESFAIAGLFQQDYSNAVRQLPGVGDVPVLGSLFRSSRWKKAETELVIIVTPRMAGGDDYHATSTIMAGNEATAIDLILNGLALDKPLAKVEGSARTGAPT
jgi:pilus assembly protein CpaC